MIVRFQPAIVISSTKNVKFIIIEPVCRKRYMSACVPIEDSYQPAHCSGLWVVKGPMFFRAENLDSDQAVPMRWLI